MPIEINVSIDDKEIRNLLTRIQRRAGNLRPALSIIGETVQASIQQNFEEGGRPDKWKSLAPSTIAQRVKENKWPGQILVRRGVGGGLMGSISYRTFSKGVTISANKVYAAIHHFGGKAGRGRKVPIPARPIMLVQNEDWREIKDAISDYLFGGI